MSNTNSYKNMIQNFNVRKIWKHIRGKHFKQDKSPKLDSDNILHTMKSKTDMKAVLPCNEFRRSLEYSRNKNNDYQVRYNPIPFSMCRWDRKHAKEHTQADFESLYIDSDDGKNWNFQNLNLRDVTYSGIKVYKPKL